MKSFYKMGMILLAKYPYVRYDCTNCYSTVENVAMRIASFISGYFQSVKPIFHCDAQLLAFGLGVR